MGRITANTTASQTHKKLTIAKPQPPIAELFTSATTTTASVATRKQLPKGVFLKFDSHSHRRISSTFEVLFDFHL